MKTKIKAFVKKIKNWLPGLSKWAKKHIIPLLTVLLMILLMCLTCFTKNKKFANANSTTVSSYYTIYIPYTQGLKMGTNNYSSMLGTLQVDEIGNFTSFTSYRVEGRDATTNSPAFNEFVPYVNEVIFNQETNKYLTYVEMAFVNQNNTPINTSCNISIYGSSLPYTANYGIISAYQSVITAQFYDVSDTLIFTISYNIPYFNFTGYSYRFSPLILRVNGNGNNYDLGYTVGYESGYNNGYEEGYIYGTGNDSPFDIILSSIDSFMTVDIFGNFSIGDLVSIGAGCILFMFAVKMFLGG